MDLGIPKFMKRLTTSYSKYFNYKYKHSGHVFQGKYKFSHIQSMERLVWLSAYVNGNPEIHGIEQAESWPHSSYQEYLGKTDDKLCDKSVAMKEFKSVTDYKNFIDTVIQETRQERRELMEDLLE